MSGVEVVAVVQPCGRPIDRSSRVECLLLDALNSRYRPNTAIYISNLGATKRTNSVSGIRTTARRLQDPNHRISSAALNPRSPCTGELPRKFDMPLFGQDVTYGHHTFDMNLTLMTTGGRQYES